MPIRITLTSDFLCPWCYLGQARLSKAVGLLERDVAVEITWRPFELNPGMPPQGMDRKEYRSRKFGWERSLMMDAQLEALGKEDGIIFNFADIKRAPNTRLAHRLLVFARASGLATAYARQVFQAYFEQGKDIGHQEVLMELISSLGLDSNAAKKFIASAGGLQEVIDAENAAHRQGINGVPRFDINGITVSGAQPVDVIRKILMQANAKCADVSASD